MAVRRNQFAIERHAKKQIVRRQQNAEQKMQHRRQKVAGCIESHLLKTNGDWESLPKVLQEITKTYSYEGLFSRKQRDKDSFKKDEPVEKKIERIAVGSKKDTFHVAFFAVAPGFKGKPHDHTGVACVSGILRGPFTEVIYKDDQNGMITADNIDVREKGSAVADLPSVGEKFIHRVQNDDKNEIAYSVHVYGTRRGTNFNHYYEEEHISPVASFR